MCGADLFNALSELFWPWVILLGAVPWVSAGHGPDCCACPTGTLFVRGWDSDRFPRAARLRPRAFAVLRLMTCSNPESADRCVADFGPLSKP
jgi:hypothetical protein